MWQGVLQPCHFSWLSDELQFVRAAILVTHQNLGSFEKSRDSPEPWTL